MKSSVPCTTAGSGLGNGKSTVEGELAILMTSSAGNFASAAIAFSVSALSFVPAIPGVVGSGDDVAEAPLEERSGVFGVSAERVITFFDWGVHGGGEILAWVFSSGSSSLSSTSLASASFARRTSTLKRHMARSLLGKVINKSVSSVSRDDSSLLTAVSIRSRSDTGGTEPEGDDVLGGVDVALIETGVDGCSGALAVAMRLGSIDLESFEADAEAAGEGDFSDAFSDAFSRVDSLDLTFFWMESTWSFNLFGSSMYLITSLSETVTKDRTILSISSVGTTSIVLTLRLSSPVNTSLLTTGDKAAKSSYRIGKLRVPERAA